VRRAEHLQEEVHLPEPW